MGHAGDEKPGLPAGWVPVPGKAGPAEDWGPGMGLVLVPAPAAAGDARGMAGVAMRLWGVGAGGADTAVLLLSEIVANAATATARLPVQPPVRFWIRPRLDMGAVLVTVWDAAPMSRRWTARRSPTTTSPGAACCSSTRCRRPGAGSPGSARRTALPVSRFGA